MENDGTLKKIFLDAGVAIDESLEDAELLELKVNDQTSTWRLFIKLPSFITSEKLREVITKVSQYFINEYKIKNVKFTIRYPEEFSTSYVIDDKDLKAYFKMAINTCVSTKKGVSILNEYFTDYESNVINILVPNENCKKIVIENLTIIKRFFDNYGLSMVRFNVDIVDDAEDILSLQNERQEIREQMDTIKSVEKYRLRQKEQDANKERKVFNYSNSKKIIECKIRDIPTTSYGLNEYGQIEGSTYVHTRGVVVTVEIKSFKKKQGNGDCNILIVGLTDYHDTVTVKRFIKSTEVAEYKRRVVPNVTLDIEGRLQWDDFLKDTVIMVDKIIVGGVNIHRVRFDEAKNKRVELHAHTKMSVLDSILSIEDYVNQAKNFGHKAIAVTDHANCHVLPELFSLCKKANIKPIAGVEGYYLNDESLNIAFTKENLNLKDATYVVFDIETSGLYIPFNEIIEIGAIKIKDGIILDQFSSLVKPKKPLHQEIIDLTKITDEMLKDELPIEEVLPKFKEFIKGSILVAHNAHFDTDFIYAGFEQLGIFEKIMPCIDTMMFARGLYGGEIKQNNLRAVGKFLKVDVEANEQHRAVYDAKTTANIFMKLLSEAIDRGYTNYQDLNKLVEEKELFRYKIPSHINILVRNKKGLKNFYKIISESHTTYFHKDARIPQSLIVKNREGLLIGSGCENGEIFRLALEKTPRQLREAMDFYDYIEVQPPKCYLNLFEMWGEVEGLKMAQMLIKEIIDIAREKNKMVVATGDVHELIEEDAEYRKIYLSVARPNGGGPHELARYKGTLDMHYRNTTEMLDEFAFLDEKTAYEIVVTNTNLINDMIETYDLFPNKLYIPRDDFMLDKNGVASMKDAVYDISYLTAYKIYGNPLPQYVKDRLDKELDAIISHGYFSVYYISHLLVKNSNDAGYIVGSRGSVGSSFVATLMGITEVNPLKPHYVCPACHYTAFKFDEKEQMKYPQEMTKEIAEELQKVQCGADLKPLKCPHCGHDLNKNGFDIEFETFLGFTGEKVPDIDLNFSGEYQAQAHLFCQKTFGVDNAFRAGTISTVQVKTAYAYAKDYYEKLNITKRNGELERIANFLSESKRTTGQHPGGIVVVPDDIEYTDIIPVQYPPVGDTTDELNWRTSHYDYHKFENNLLKLDILGHDDPTVVKCLMDYVHANQKEFAFSTVEDIPYTDEKVIALFSSKKSLGLDDDDIDNLASGTIGVPEFGTQFVRSMLETIRPNCISQIIKVSGLAHGTDVWMNNAEDLVKGIHLSKPIKFNDVIGCRDDIMTFLIMYGLPTDKSFKIMESVRKGKGLTEEDENLLYEHHVPNWFVNSCKKIKYLFPKAHATAYVIMALRIAWFKVYKPIYYYAAYFSKRAKEFDAEAFAMGKNAILNRINEIERKNKAKNKEEGPSKKEIDLLDELKIALEMVLRGYSFKQVDINISDATDLVIAPDHRSLYLPLIAVESLGNTVAVSIVEARKERPFSSKKDFTLRTPINKTQYANLVKLEAFGDLPDDDTTLL